MKGSVHHANDSFSRLAKVTRSALQNAASIAAMILTTEALITDLPEKEQPAVAAMPAY